MALALECELRELDPLAVGRVARSLTLTLALALALTPTLTLTLALTLTQVEAQTRKRGAETRPGASSAPPTAAPSTRAPGAARAPHQQQVGFARVYCLTYERQSISFLHHLFLSLLLSQGRRRSLTVARATCATWRRGKPNLSAYATSDCSPIRLKTTLVSQFDRYTDPRVQPSTGGGAPILLLLAQRQGCVGWEHETRDGPYK